MEMSAGSSNAPTQDMKFMMASNVNVSNFVSVKLSGRINYRIWKVQMICLIKSQALLHIIDTESPFPVDNMTPQYDQLVKGWIFSTMSDHVLNNFADFDSAREVWMKMESGFGLPIRGIERVSSNALDVSTRTDDLRYMLALNVNISDFVSVRLSDRNNYDVWKTQMLCLIESHELLHIIHAEFRFPEDGDRMSQKYDKLVKGWILSTMNDKVRHDFWIYQSVQLMWRNLESTFTDQSETLSNTDGVSSENMKYERASSVNVSAFVSEKLSGRNNYHDWKTQMLCLIESHDLLPILGYGGVYQKVMKYKVLVKGWILGTMNEPLLKEFAPYPAELVWTELEDRFTDGDSSDVFAPKPDLKFMHASNVNVSSFVSVKLSGHSNYEIWKAQMLCLIKSQELFHIIDPDRDLRVEDKYEHLARGWILGTMNDQILMEFGSYTPAKFLWTGLESKYNPLKRDGETEDDTSLGFEFRTESVRDIPEVENTSSITESVIKELYDAAVEGCWWKAKSILKIHKKAAKEVITTANGNTILHLAVEMGHNYFLEKLLEFLEDGKDIETQNSKGRTALHIAAMVGNTHAAQLLVQKRKQLLQIEDCYEKLPFYIATMNRKLNMSAYLFKSTLPSDSVAYPDLYQGFALYDAIITKQYDLAEILLKKSPGLALKGYTLMAITITFPSDLGFMESFIYPSFHNARQKTIVRDSLLFHPYRCVDDIIRVVKICNNTCCSWLGKNSMIFLVPIATLYPIYQLICLLVLMLRLTFSTFYFLLWKVLVVIVPPIKNIEKKKKEYQEAKKVLNLICTQIGSSHINGYSEPLFEAVHQGAYEVVDEILFTSPATINCKDEEGYNVIQSAIINRSEKVYNLIYHIIKRKESYRRVTDSSGNNLVHLVGRLAPSFVLSRTTGAALQLQQELLWREEVKKLLSPLELRQDNNYKETPAMVFTREHQDLMKQGENWMKTTAESCSITAALIVTIVFAAAITVPGGSNQESGIPVFKKNTAFTIFAASNAFSLFTATTSLLLFLSILTTRFSEKDFLVSLPRRLIFGLFTLFLSTTAMIVAFCAILFLVFCDQRPWMMAPIAGFACLPILVIVTIKLPLLIDLMQSTYSPIFGKKSYLDSCKINMKNTIFTE